MRSIPLGLRIRLFLLELLLPALRIYFLLPTALIELRELQWRVSPFMLILRVKSYGRFWTKNDYSGFFPDWGEALWMLAWGIWGGMLAGFIRHPGWISVGLSGSATVLIGSCYLLFLNAVWVPVWPALLTLGLTGGGVFSYKALYKLLYDPLTGLPQKTLFLKMVDRALRSSYRKNHQKCLAILFVDLDGFKRINESLGHDKGDHLLLMLTARFRKILPPRSHISRFVGDKFAIQVSDLAHDDDAIAIARTLQTTVQHPIKIDDQAIVASASIGIALQPSDTEISAGELLRDAQTATHQAKARGKNHIEVVY